MKHRSILVIAGLVLVAFGFGVWMGKRRKVGAEGNEAVPGFRQSVRAPAAAPAGDPFPSPAASSSTACVDIRNAGTLEGKSGCVSGLILRVYSSRSGNTFLDFCQDYHACPFTSVIFASDATKFGNMESLQGKRVEIRGEITEYQGRAELVIRDPQQVRSAP